MTAAVRRSGHAMARLVLGVMFTALLAAFPACASHDEAAERFVAAHGFSKPVQLATSASSTRVAVATDAETPYAYWYDSAGLYRKPLIDDRPTELVRQGRGTRDLDAVTVAGEPALALVIRDFTTGRHEHIVTWRNQSRTVASSLQVQAVALGAAADGPVWAVREPSALGSALTVGGWQRDAIVIRESHESIAGYDIATSSDGSMWVSWLEGSTDQTALGAFSAWHAYVVRLDPSGASGDPIALGPAVHRGRLDLTRLAVVDGRPASVLWPREDGRLVATTFAAGSDGGDPSIAAMARVHRELGAGVPIGVFEGFAYWAEGDRVLSMRLEAGGATRQVVWAPNAIESVAAERPETDDLFLAWYGATLRGGFAIYGAGTHAAFEPDWRDRLAAAMGWNPWDVWSEALGQLLTSLLVGVLATMALSPLLWLVAVLALKLTPFERWTVLGIAVGGGVVAVVLGSARLAATLPPAQLSSLFGTGPQVVAALAVAAVVTWLLRRRADSEALLGTLVAAASCAGIAFAILSFITFQAWSRVGPGIL